MMSSIYLCVHLFTTGNLYLWWTRTHGAVCRPSWTSPVLIGCELASSLAITLTAAFAARMAFWDTASPSAAIRRSSGTRHNSQILMITERNNHVTPPDLPELLLLLLLLFRRLLFSVVTPPALPELLLLLLFHWLSFSVSFCSMKYLDDEIESFLVDLAQRIIRMKRRRFQHLVRKLCYKFLLVLTLVNISTVWLAI